MTGTDLYLTDTVSAGPDSRERAEAIREAFILQIAQKRSPRTDASIELMLTTYLDEWEGSDSFRNGQRSYLKNHVKPLIGSIKARDATWETFDLFYRKLRHCRRHCEGKVTVDHRTKKNHNCDHRCVRHQCRGLGKTAIRHIHFMLSGAYNRAWKRWKWVVGNPMDEVETPSAPPPSPKPPTAQQAVLIVNASWEDPDWGALVWVAMTTGARRGELCALRWDDLDWGSVGPNGESAIDRGATVWIARSIKKVKPSWKEGPTKSHQERRVVLDQQTVDVLREHRQRAEARAAAMGLTLAPDSFIFSPASDNSRFYTPSALTQRFHRLVTQLGIKSTFHKLRHYSATELILGGVDVRTVAGRIGHSGGGTTTLKVYTAFVSEADQRASGTIALRMPERPVKVPALEKMATAPKHPYQNVAVAVRDRIAKGAYASGELAPTLDEVAREFEVSIGTAHRAVELLRDWGVVSRTVERGRSKIVAPAVWTVSTDHSMAVDSQDAKQQVADAIKCVPVDLDLLCAGTTVSTVRASVDPDCDASLHSLLVDALRRKGVDLQEIGRYELNVRPRGQSQVIVTYVATAKAA